MDKDFSNDPFHQAATMAKKRKKRKKNQEAEDSSFMSKKVNLVDSILFPEGYENFMIGVYFLIIPYIDGLLFIFLYIGKGDYTIFLSLSSENSFIITWLIGYEVTAGIILLWIVKLGLGALMKSSHNKKRKPFVIP